MQWLDAASQKRERQDLPEEVDGKRFEGCAPVFAVLDPFAAGEIQKSKRPVQRRHVDASGNRRQANQSFWSASSNAAQ